MHNKSVSGLRGDISKIYRQCVQEYSRLIVCQFGRLLLLS
jgi:hypothetical protein